MTKWTKRQKEAFEECLKLWKYLSELPDKRVTSHLGFKNEALRQLGMGIFAGGCPFCEKFYRLDNCPLGDCRNASLCYQTPYGIWEREISITDWHRQALAKDFYDYLLKLYKEGISLR